MLSTFVVCLFSLSLTGCNEDDKKEAKPPIPKASLDNDFYKVEPLPEPEVVAPPPPEPIYEPEVIPEVVFPDTRPLFREKRARQLRGRRSHYARVRDRHFTVSRPEQDSFHLEDDDYQKGETQFPQDLSTLPVDRTRILTADMRIPAIIEDSVNTQNPGRLIAIVDKDILSPNGKKILLPAYSKIICSYEGLTDANSSRLAVQCTRVIRPDGLSISLTNATGADIVGRSGLSGDLDKRNFERYGAAFGVSLISALSQTATSNDKQDAFSNATNQLSTNLGQVTQKILDQTINLMPILTLPQGARIQIIPLNDIVFKKPIRFSSSSEKKD